MTTSELSSAFQQSRFILERGGIDVVRIAFIQRNNRYYYKSATCVHDKYMH
jgi:hypothetical protein